MAAGNYKLNYYKGYVYWTSAEDETLYDWNRGQYEVKKTIIHKLKVANMK